MRLRYRPYITAGIAVVGAGVIAVTPTTAPLPHVYVSDIQLTSGDATDVIIDVVRHAQMISPFEDELTPSPAFPGAPLSDLGQQQAQDLASKLFDQLGPHVAGIFEGQGLREMETAAPFAALENMSGNVPILPGLDEIDSGIYALDPIESPGGQLAFLTAGAWSLGAPFGLALEQAPGSSDVNGVVFDARFTGAIDTMYNALLANPVVSDNDQITGVAFNSEASIFVWALDNVKNPDLPFFINRIIEAHTVPNGLSTVLLPNTGVVQIEGNPTDGWTLVSWDGQAIPQDPDLLSSLFVDVRDVALPTQAAEWNIWEAILGGDSTTIMNAVQTGFEQVDSALAHFPESVFNSIADALTNVVATEAGAQSGTALSDLLATLF
ncbi:MAG TPA: histidine phosphatase family protein [Mycobacterium sp.]|jgi:broad specificity phosphatase PhoE|uniref:phosphoglycerate mutase family protein n=1 Tax=Mycobacterium sp. TaxID=1785 RepID=UPI002F3F8F30